MPLIYHITPLDAHGETIPARMPYEAPFDPHEGNRRVLLIEDSILAAQGRLAAKSNKQILADTVTAAEEWKAKLPVRLPLSCAEVRVVASDGYQARYTIRPLPYKPSVVRITDENSEFAEFYGQPFQAEFAQWPFGRPDERLETLTVRICEPLPYGEEERSTRMGREMINATLSPGWRAHFTGMNLRMGTADVIGSRLRPVRMARTAVRIGRRG